MFESMKAPHAKLNKILMIGKRKFDLLNFKLKQTLELPTTNDKSMYTSNKDFCCAQLYQGSLYIYDKAGTYTVIHVHVTSYLILEERFIRNISQTRETYMCQVICDRMQLLQCGSVK